MDHRKKILFGVSVAAFLAPFTQTVYTPSLPEIQADFGVNSFMVNLTISLFTFILASSQFIIGPLTDTRGRKIILMAGLFLFMAGSLICLLSPNYYLFLFGRAVQAFGISTGSVVAAAVIGDIYEPRDRGGAMSIYQTMVFLGPVLGPVFGSLIAGYLYWQWSFLLLFVVAMFIFIYNRIVLYETLSKDEIPDKITPRTFKKIVMQRSSFSVMLLGFMQFYGYYIYLVFLPGLLDRLYQVPVTTKGLLFMPITAGLVIGSIGGRKLQQYVTRKMILISTSYGVGMVVLIFWICLTLDLMPIPVLVALLLAYGVMSGISLPAQTTTLINLFQKQKGTAIGAYNVLRFTGAGVGPLVGAILFDLGGDFALFLSLSALLFVAAVILQLNMYDPYDIVQRENVSA